MTVRIGLIVSNISRLGGGVSQAVARLAQLLRDTGDVRPIIFSARDPCLEDDIKNLNGIEVVARPRLGPAAFNYLPNLLEDVIARDIDVLHLHGIWQYPSVLGTAWRRRTRRPYLVSPHGMLESWILQRGRAKKAVGGWLYERRNVKSASLVHALTDAERDQILRYVPRSRVVVIPNGVHAPGKGDQRPRTAPPRVRDMDASRGEPSPYVLYLGRIHPKKNIERTIEAWASIRELDIPAPYRLLIAGWGEPLYVEEIEKKIAALGPNARIDFVGPAYGDTKSRLLNQARWLILPSFSEGLPMAVLEAWAAGTPSIISRFCNLPEGFLYQAAFECDTARESIRSTLLRAMNLPDSSWDAMSNAAHALAVGRFSTEAVAGTWLKTYQQLLGAPWLGDSRTAAPSNLQNANDGRTG